MECVRYLSITLYIILMFYEAKLEIPKCEPLPNSQITCYQTLVAGLNFRLHTNHRISRDLGVTVKDFHLNAFSEEFHIQLKPHTELFDNSFRVDVINKIGNRTIHFDHSNFYSGHVKGKQRSYAHGWVENGTFDGLFVTEHDSYFVEPTYKYFAGEQQFSSVVFRSSDIIFNDTHAPRCGVRSKTNDYSNYAYRNHSLNKKWHTSFLRQKRNQPAAVAKVCKLHVVADHLFFENVGLGSVGKSIKEMAHFVANADTIYRETDFDGDGHSENIGFKIGKITVYQDDKAPNYELKGITKVGLYLDTFSKTHNFSTFCLGLGYTYIDFPRGVIGLAYIGNKAFFGVVGGICQKYIRYQGNWISFNSVFVSLENYGSRVPRLMASITTAHELGHAFGSDHDDSFNTPTCVPGTFEGGKDAGNYVMFPIAGNGLRPNHRIFSSCSRQAMWEVLVEKGGCFIDDQTAICGNGVREIGEECDCGDAQSCPFIDPCCIPAGTPMPCTIKRTEGYTCSGSSLCCNPETCQVVDAKEMRVCEAETDCTEEAYCNGLLDECPKARLHPDGYSCSFGLMVCDHGMCNSTICARKGLSECQCSGSEEYLCVLCCKDDDGTCSPYFTDNGEIIHKTHGELCANDQGVCESAGKCLRTKNEVAKRFLQLFSEEGWETISDWFAGYWHFLFLGISVLVIAGIIFKIKFSKAKEPIHALAYRTGNMARVWFEARRQGGIIQKKFEYVRNIQPMEAAEMDLVVATSRMQMMFPQAPRETVMHVMHKSSNEEYAVRYLLLKGYPMEKLC